MIVMYCCWEELQVVASFEPVGGGRKSIEGSITGRDDDTVAGKELGNSPINRTSRNGKSQGDEN
jgi:hypothetical protein